MTQSMALDYVLAFHCPSYHRTFNLFVLPESSSVRLVILVSLYLIVTLPDAYALPCYDSLGGDFHLQRTKVLLRDANKVSEYKHNLRHKQTFEGRPQSLFNLTVALI